MAGTFVSDTIQDGAGNTVPTTTAIKGSARAWVQFNGQGTVAIRNSFNVASITDHGTGNYTINFTTSMPNANYVIVGCADYAGVVSEDPITPTRTTTAIRFYTYQTTNGAPVDYPNVSVAIFSS